MTTNAEHRSFGRYLQSARIEKGISLEQVAAETRIRKETLTLIENEDYLNLPDDVFVKGFLRAYAQAVGADPAEAVHRYVSRRSLFDAVSGPGDVSEHKVSRLWLRLPAALFGIAAIIAGSIYVSAVMQSKPTPQTHPPAAETLPPSPPPVVETQTPAPPAVEEPGLPDASAALEEAPPLPSEEKPPPEATKMILRVRTVEKTWLKIIIDEQEPKEYSLRPGDELEIEALHGYNLLIGNARGIRMSLNDREMVIPGKRGEVVSLRLPVD